MVWRDRAGRREFVVVHRPRYDDWSLPKGKAHRDESDRDTALREVAEETGLRCELGDELPSVRYVTPRGEDKRVRWWAMTVAGDAGFVAGDEVDEIRWVDRSEFVELGANPSDISVVEAFFAL
ncbi:MAG: NUDIX domain-containing protein [Microthrixaceae bacterium]